MVTWDHPPAPNQNGAITNYTVIRQTGSEIITIEPASNDTSLLLTDLMPFTVYSITVAGSTSAGRGEFTTPVTMKTRIDSECTWKMVHWQLCITNFRHILNAQLLSSFVHAPTILSYMYVLNTTMPW